jgi:hypothetical protein
MDTDEIIEKITALLAKLADAGDVDESWELQEVIDTLYPDNEKDQI